jgi:hypothetical protein
MKMKGNPWDPRYLYAVFVEGNPTRFFDDYEEAKEYMEENDGPSTIFKIPAEAHY